MNSELEFTIPMLTDLISLMTPGTCYRILFFGCAKIKTGACTLAAFGHWIEGLKN
ncbi:hypothetical protein [Microcoleus sp. D2_18a_D3]|uniref:hypothetical protein n=1 Tax=Microcoleus sp. D2_18a_D3 TaxID=3055330 RepID=UPI002FD41A71